MLLNKSCAKATPTKPAEKRELFTMMTAHLKRLLLKKPAVKPVKKESESDYYSSSKQVAPTKPSANAAKKVKYSEEEVAPKKSKLLYSLPLNLQRKSIKNEEEFAKHIDFGTDIHLTDTREIQMK